MANWYNMVWNVYVDSMLRKEIKVHNIFDHTRFKEDVLRALKKSKTKEEFAPLLRRELFYYYGSKCEWEVVVTDWPPRIKMDELDRLNAEREEFQGRNQKDPCSLYVNVEPEKKVDVYTQVFNNWDVFLDYVWSFKRTRVRKTVDNGENAEKK